jgi:hypothetical protein
MQQETSGGFDRGDGVPLAWRRLPGHGPTVVFLPGFASNMAGAKATHVAEYCAARGRAMLRLDYSGHGESGGAFAAGGIGRWRDDAMALLDHLTAGPLVLVGSSMGGWIALLIALARPARVAGLIGLAAAPDFTEDLMWDAATPLEQAALMAQGQVEIPTADGGAHVVTRTLIEDGRRHLLLRRPIALEIPIRLIHGQLDADVPWQTALKIAAAVTGGDVRVTLVKDGDHRLSRAQDLALLIATVAGLAPIQAS